MWRSKTAFLGVPNYMITFVAELLPLNISWFDGMKGGSAKARFSLIPIAYTIQTAAQFSEPVSPAW